MSSSPVDPRDGAAGPPAVQPRWADAPTAAALTRALHAWPSHVLTASQAAALLRLLDGVYTPLAGFMTAPRLRAPPARTPSTTGPWWPVPVILDVLPATAERLATGGPLVLREAEGRAVAVMPEGQAWQDSVRLARRRPRRRPAGAARLRPDRPAALPHRGPGRDRPARLADGDRGAGRSRPAPRRHRRARRPGRGARRRAGDLGRHARRRRRRPRSLRAPAGAARARWRICRPGAACSSSTRGPRPRARPGSAIDAVLARAFGCARWWRGARRRLRWPRRPPRRESRVDVVRSAPARRPRDASAAAVDAWTFPEVAAELARRRRRRRRAASPSSSPACRAPASRRSPTRCASACSRTAGRTVTLLDGDLVRDAPVVRAGLLARAPQPQRAPHRLRRGRDHAARRRRDLRADRAVRAISAARRARSSRRAGPSCWSTSRRRSRCARRAIRRGCISAARAGTLPEFTGVSDPYEVPDDADVTIDTSRVSVAQAVDLLMRGARGAPAAHADDRVAACGTRRGPDRRPGVTPSSAASTGVIGLGVLHGDVRWSSRSGPRRRSAWAPAWPDGRQHHRRVAVLVFGCQRRNEMNVHDDRVPARAPPSASPHGSRPATLQGAFRTRRIRAIARQRCAIPAKSTRSGGWTPAGKSLGGAPFG